MNAGRGAGPAGGGTGRRPPPPETTRVGFVPGQPLAAADLAAAVRRPRDLLALHTAVGHGVWGVATGLTGVATVDGVSVAPGVALDLAGRTLLLSAPVLLRYPTPPAEPTGGTWCYDLVARYARTAELRAGAGCGGPLGERPALRFEPAGFRAAAATGSAARAAADPPLAAGVVLGLDVPLARLRLPAGTPAASPTLDTGVRHVAHGLVRPHIGTGTVPQATLPESAVAGRVVDWTATIDTSAAGFASQSPAYLVALGAHPYGATASLGAADGGAGPDLPTRLSAGVGPVVAIESAGRTSLTIRVHTYAPRVWGSWATDDPHGGGVLHTNPVPISWVGVETPFRPFLLLPIFTVWLTLPFARRLAASPAGPGPGGPAATPATPATTVFDAGSREPR